MPTNDGYEAGVQEERRQKDLFMARHPESPFVDAAVAGFVGLAYFPIDPKFRISATLERLGSPREAFLRTNRDGQMECRYVGDLLFSIGGQKLRLRAYHAGEQVGPRMFVPFRDRTSGSESYGPGRYLTFDLAEDDTYELDFNLSFNPYCAYTDAYECGFPPSENDLPVRIPAGEKAWSLERNPAGPSSAIEDMTRKTLAARSGKKVGAPSPSPTRKSSRSVRKPASRKPGSSASSKR